MSEQWDIRCTDCGKFILTEEREHIGGNVKCVVGSYENGVYDEKEDIFYCKDCAEKRGFCGKNAPRQVSMENKIECTKFTSKLPNYKDLLRYGEIISDREFVNKNNSIRVRKIKYMDILYHLKMEDGEVVSLKQWDNFSYTENELDIANMEDNELADKLMFSDRDRKNNKKAENVYRLCIKEINRRNV